MATCLSAGGEQANNILSGIFDTIATSIPEGSPDYGLGPYSDQNIQYFSRGQYLFAIKRQGSYPPNIIIDQRFIYDWMHDLMWNSQLPLSSIEITKSDKTSSNIHMIVYSRPYWTQKGPDGLDRKVNFRIGHIGEYNMYRGFERLAGIFVEIEDHSNEYVSPHILEVYDEKPCEFTLRDGKQISIEFDDHSQMYTITMKVASDSDDDIGVTFIEEVRVLEGIEFDEIATRLAEFFNPPPASSTSTCY